MAEEQTTEDPLILERGNSLEERKASRAIENVAGEILTYFRSKLRNKLYFYSTISTARTAALKELDSYQVPKLEEIKKYVDTLESLNKL